MPKSTSKTGSTLRQLAEREERVFASYPQVSRYFPAAAIEDARFRLGRAIERGDGPGLLIGAPGTGKSLLLQVLAAQHHKRFDVALLACSCLCTRRALLQAILFELGMPYKMRDEGELRLSLLDHLLAEDRQTGLLLLVDEAQLLSAALLDELRVLTNLVRGGAPRVRLVVAGSSALEESFANPELESFSQRLSARCYVAPLSRDETCQFIRAQVTACGGAPDDVFAADAWGAAFDATDGVPRLVNQLCDRALQMAVAKNAPRIESHVIQQAWADLQQLPTPWETPPADVTEAITSQVIEFGCLNVDLPSGDRDDAMAMFEIEPTELDIDEVTVMKTQAQAAPSSKAGDPFAEKFDEEEVVLDNFAAWDDMIHRETPRVQNRREPMFATLVQAAIAAAPVSATHLEDHQVETSIEAEQSGDDNSAPKAPRLRLAVVEDVPPSGRPHRVATVADFASNLGSALDAILQADEPKLSAFDEAQEEDPVLVIEDDQATTNQPPVRREDYRQLFSRLRSG